MSEARAIRRYVERYCIGTGLDIGCGNEKIVPGAIGIDFAMQYNDPHHPAGPTAADYKGPWQRYFAEHVDDRYDYIFSSHLLEDSPHAVEDLAAWARRVKPQGRLILCLPNERLYREACDRAGSPRNGAHHNYWDGSADFIAQVVAHVSPLKVIACGDPAGYSFWVVLDRGEGKVLIQ